MATVGSYGEGVSYERGTPVCGGAARGITFSVLDCSLSMLLKTKPGMRVSGDTAPCRMTGVTLHSHVHYKEV